MSHIEYKLIKWVEESSWGFQSEKVGCSWQNDGIKQVVHMIIFEYFGEKDVAFLWILREVCFGFEGYFLFYIDVEKEERPSQAVKGKET